MLTDDNAVLKRGAITITLRELQWQLKRPMEGVPTLTARPGIQGNKHPGWYVLCVKRLKKEKKKREKKEKKKQDFLIKKPPIKETIVL